MKYDEYLYKNLELLKEFILNEVPSNYKLQIKDIFDNCRYIGLDNIIDGEIHKITFAYHTALFIENDDDPSSDDFVGMWYNSDGDTIKISHLDVLREFNKKKRFINGNS
jgi:hypothetical protein